MSDNSDRLHFEIRRSVVHDRLQREFVEIFDILDPSDFQREMEKLKSINTKELKLIIITNLGDMKYE